MPRTRNLLSLATIAVFLAIFVLKATSPPIADDVDFTKPIQKWITAGPQHEGLWHTPFYPWLLSLLGRIWGGAPSVFRCVGAFCVLLSALFAVLGARRLSLSGKTEPFLWLIFLLSPVAIGSSLILDYDTTLLAAATSAFFFTLITQEGREPSAWLGSVTVYSIVLAITFMAKETTPLAYGVGILFTHQSRWGWGRAFVAAACSALVGALLALGVVSIWCHYFTLPLSDVFAMAKLGLSFNFQPRAGGPFDGWSLKNAVWLRLAPLLWVGPPIFVLLLANLRQMIKRGGAISGIAVTCLSVWFVYSFVIRQMTYQFPKYMAPILLWMVWLTWVEFEKQGRRFLIPGLWTVFCGVWLFVMPDVLSAIYVRDITTVARSLMIWAAPLVIYGVLKYSGKIRLMTFAEATLVLCACSAFPYAKAALLSSRSISYWYGENAIAEARALIEHLPKQARDSSSPTSRRIISPVKDIAWSLKDLGAEFIPTAELVVMTAKLCATKQESAPSEIYVISRIREDSSITRAPELAALKACMDKVEEGRDIALGRILSAKGL